MLALVVVLLAQAPDPSDLPPPPPLLDAPADAAPSEPAPSDAAPSDAAPAAATAPTTATTPSTAKPVAKLKQPRPDVRGKSEPLDPLLVGVLQALVPCGVSALGVPCALFVGTAIPGGYCFACLLPAASGYAATILGDRFGPSRAPAIWPVVASYTAAVAALAAAVALYGAVEVNSSFGDPSTLYGATAVSLAIATLAVVAVPVSYALTAEKKHDGDDGTATPGFLTPGHPDAQRY